MMNTSKQAANKATNTSMTKGLPTSTRTSGHGSTKTPNRKSSPFKLYVFGAVATIIVMAQVSMFIHTHNDAFAPHNLYSSLEFAPPEDDVRAAMQFTAKVVSQMKNDLTRYTEEAEGTTTSVEKSALAIQSAVNIASDELDRLEGRLDQYTFLDKILRDQYDELLNYMNDVAEVIHDLTDQQGRDGDTKKKKRQKKEEESLSTTKKTFTVATPKELNVTLKKMSDRIDAFRSDSFEKRFHYYDTTNPSQAWLGEVDDKQRHLESVNKLHMVVAHCDKDLSWLRQFTRGRIRGRDRSIESLTVFSKCGKPVTGVPRYAKVINMENVGRCDHTYAHWMANYAANEELNDNDVVFFVKDNPYQTRQGHWRPFNKMLGTVSRNGFSCALRPNYMWPLRDLEPSTFHLWDLIKTFGYKETYKRQGGAQLKKATRGSWGVNMEVKEQKVEQKVEKTDAEEAAEAEKQKIKHTEFISKYDNLQHWSNEMGIEEPEFFTPVCYGGVFATSVRQIRKKLDTFRVIETSLSRADNLEEGHFAERSWARLLTRPLSPDGVLDIAARVDDSPCRNYAIEGYSQYWKDRCGTLVHDRYLHPEMHPQTDNESNKSASSLERRR